MNSFAKLAGMLLVGFAATTSWAAPANDNFASAAIIKGTTGSTTGSNLGATAEPGEPVDAGDGGGNSIWYAWTAPFTGAILFNTEGSAFDTVMGVYTGKAVTNLTLVAQNDDVSFPNDLTSQVQFPVVAGVTYFISVDGNEGDEGSVTLNWRATGSQSFGQFSFAASQGTATGALAGFPLYIVGADDSTAGVENAPWMRDFGPRARVIRTMGTAGKVTVNYSVTNFTYTNTYETNIFGTNVYTTNSDGTYSNLLLTNFVSVNIFGNFANGFFNTNLQVYTSFTITVTNVFANGASNTSSSLIQMGTNLVAPGLCLNSTNSGLSTNANNIITITTTNIFCFPVFITNVFVASAIPGRDYTPIVGRNLTMVDYQQAADIPYTIFDSGINVAGDTNNLISNLVNRLLLIRINSVTPDPSESTNLAAPVIVNSTAAVEILNKNVLSSGFGYQVIINFAKSVNWMDEFPNYNAVPKPSANQRTARIWCKRTGYDGTQSFSVNYVIDQVDPPVGPTDALDSFPLQPASDYATPTNSIPGSREPTRFPPITGTLTWGAEDFSDKSIDIPITYDPEVQFNEDLLVEIWAPPSTVGAVGQLGTSTVTILFNDQPAGAVDRDHNPNNSPLTTPALNQAPGAGSSNSIVYAAVVQPDNKTVFGGDFRTYNGTAINRIARMNSDGSLDTTFLASSSGADNTVTCLALQPNGQIAMGGVFSSINGTSRPHFARLNSDGSLDTNFNTGVGPNDTVWATALQADGRIIIGGNFTAVNTTNYNFIARLNTNGTLDTTFNVGVGPNGTVNAVVVQTDGKIVIGGQFTSVDNTNLNFIARLNSDGTLDTTFNPGLGANQQVRAIVQQPDGRLVIGGAFTTINLTPRNSIARLNTDGSIDLTFDPGTGADDIVYALALQPDGGILMGGVFTSFNSTRRIGVARLYNTGSLDTTFADTGYNQFAGLINTLNNQSVQPKNFLYTIALQLDGNVIIGGRFSLLGGGVNYTTKDLNGAIGTSIGLFARDTYSPRENIARLIGGSTPGPGNVGLQYPNYSVEKSGEDYYVSLIRQNGNLGPASVTLQPNPQHNGVGDAVPNVNYVQDILTPSWVADGTWMDSDAFSGPNYRANDVLGGANLSSFGNATISILDDPNSSGNQNLNLQLTQPTGSLALGGEPIPTGVALGLASSPLTIVDDSVPGGVVSFSTTNYFVNENATNASITVVRTNGSSGALTVNYQTLPGTAFPGATNDYIATSGVLTFADGQTTATINIGIVNNFIVRPDRSLSINLFNVSGGALGTSATATLTIINDNFTAGQLSFSSPNFTALQDSGQATITATRLGGSQGTVSISYSATAGTASNGLDFLATNGVLTWNSGDTSNKTFTVKLLNSGLVNTNLTVNLQLYNPMIAGAVNTNLIGQFTNATLTIIDQNSYGNPTLSASSYTVNENAGAAVITVNRLGGSSGTMTVDYATSDGTAHLSSDYLPVSGTLTFTNGQFSESFSVPIINNTIQTNNGDFFTVTLSNPTPSSGPGGGVVLGVPSSAPVTIIANQVNNQSPGSSDQTFNSGANFNNTVYSVALQNDGSLIAGGDFTQANGIARNKIARLDSTGALDVKFSSETGGANGSVRSVVLQSDGQVLVGGLFTTFNNVNQSYLTRLNFDGSLDSTFSIGAGPNNPVYAIAETFSGGFANANRKVIIGGSFAAVGQSNYRSIAELNEDGSVNTNFNASADGTVYAIAVYSTNDINSGKIIIGGDFATVDGISMSHLARLNADGSVDTSFNASPSDSVRSVAIQIDGNVVIGGLFTSVNNTAMNYVARLDYTGALDSAFTPGVGANGPVLAIALQQDLKIVLGGSFTQASGVTRNRLTRLNADGTVDASINFGQGANDFVDAVVVQPDTKILIGGNFTQFDGASKPRIDRIFGGSITGAGSVQFPSPGFQVNQNALTSTNVVITVERVGGTGANGSYDGPVSVLFSTSDGTGVAGIDYTGVTNLLTFNVGETFQSVTIPILANPTNFSEVTVNLNLSNPTTGDPTTFAPLGGQTAAVLDIIGASSAVSFSAAGYSVIKNIASGGAIITIDRNGSDVGTASIDFSTTTNGTAVAGIDFTPVTNTVIFANNQTTATVIVPILTNNIPDGNPTIGLALFNPTNTVLDTTLPTAATLTIIDNSQSPGTFAFSAPSYTVSERATNAVITVIRTNGSVGSVSVAYSVSGGNAVAGTNYIATNNILSFVDGQTSATFLVPILNDTNLSENVSVNLTLTQLPGQPGILGSSTAQLLIQDENLDVNFGAFGYFVAENMGSIVISVNRFGDTNTTAVVNYATTNGTAIAGVNYTSTSGTLTFGPGQTLQSFIVPIIDDPQITGDLIFLINLSTSNNSPVQLVTPSTIPVTVQDDDSGFKLSVATNTVEKVVTNVVITVLRSGNTSASNAVSFATTGGTATAGVEYLPTNGVLNFLSGQTSNSFSIQILNDGLIDGNQSVNYAISNPLIGSILSPSSGVLNIVDTESGIQFSSPTYSVTENGIAASITVTRTGVTDTTVSVNYATSDGTAHSGAQYQPASGTLVFTNGQTSASFNVPIIDNNVTGGSETVNLLLSNPSSLTTLQNPIAATLTILNNDGSIIVQAGSAVVTPANSVITPGATVSVLLSLLNSAGAEATNVTATLLATNGVTPVGNATQPYGNLFANGPSVFQQFTFVANGTNGGTINAVLKLQYDATNTSFVSYTYILGTSTNYYSNPSFITINDLAPATPYPSTINISAQVGLITQAAVTVSNLGHGWVSDVAMLLVGPAGQKELLMEDTGGPHVITNVTLTFNGTATNHLFTNAPVTGTYLPSPLQTTAKFPTSTNGVTPPAGPYNTNMNDFNGTNPNGTWSLYVSDNQFLQSGAINNGWSLAIVSINAVVANVDLVVGESANPNPVVIGSNLTYTVSVTNAGPSTATGILLTDVLPAGASLVSVNSPNGYTNNNGTITLGLNSLVTNATATVTIVVSSPVIGEVTNAVSVSANEVEDNPINNTATLVSTVEAAKADLAITVTASQDPTFYPGQLTLTVNVTNIGPATATDVFVTNSLPPDVTLVSDNASGGFVNASGFITSTLGNMGSGAPAATFNIVVQPNVAAVSTNIYSFGVGSDIPDPFKGNNTAQVKSVVLLVPLGVTHSGNSLTFTWPATGNTTYSLQETSSLKAPVIWTTIATNPTVSGGVNSVTISTSSGNNFYRLISN